MRQNKRAVGPGSKPYAEWLRRMSSSPALSGTLKLPQIFTVVHDLDELLYAIFPAIDFAQRMTTINGIHDALFYLRSMKQKRK